MAPLKTRHTAAESAKLDASLGAAFDDDVAGLSIARDQPRNTPITGERIGPALLFLAHYFFFPAIVFKAGWHPEWLTTTVGVWFLQSCGGFLSFHRFFAHRGFDTSRWFAFVLGVVGATCGQGGLLYWAGTHRHHHKVCDVVGDPHSPLEWGDGLPRILQFLYAQGGWMLVRGTEPAELWWSSVRDWSRYPELRVLHEVTPTLFLSAGAAIFYFHGLVGFAYAFALPTMVSWNGMQLVNSATHMIGERKYDVAGSLNCEAHNIWWLWPLLLGENNHNNHHAFPHCARQGFEWWEIDPIYYLLKLLEVLGLVWNLRQPPADRAKWLREDWKAANAAKTKAKAKAPPAYPVDVRG